MADIVVMAIEPEKTSHENHVLKGLIFADCTECCRFFTAAVARGRVKMEGRRD